MLEHFHFLRPFWLVAIIPAIVLLITSIRNQFKNKTTLNFCDTHLCDYIIIENHKNSNVIFSSIIFMIWMLMILALSGPTWSHYNQNLYQKSNARVIVLDVSRSMNTTDIVPSRLKRAQYKILDMLNLIKEGQIGMVIFSGQAFTVSPLTNDANTISSMVPVLNSNIVPSEGNNMNSGILKAAKLINQAGFNKGNIILITDTEPKKSTYEIVEKLKDEGIITSILAIGTNKGAPMKNKNDTFVTNKEGNIIFSKLNQRALQNLATVGGGVYTLFNDNNTDIDKLIHRYNPEKESQILNKKQNTVIWKDQGHWIIWFLIIMTSFFGRKGWWEKICR